MKRLEDFYYSFEDSTKYEMDLSDLGLRRNFMSQKAIVEHLSIKSLRAFGFGRAQLLGKAN